VERTWAVIVARVGKGAKSRLASVLSPDERRGLALAMLADVVDVCASASLTGSLAVVDDDEARLVAQRAGAWTVADPGAGDMNAAVAAGVRAAMEHGATVVVIVPGDVPRITRADIAALLEAAGTASQAVVLGASHDGQGTNALLLRPPQVIAPAFGPPSLTRHHDAGLTAGALTLVRSGLGLAHDVDTPSDLAALPAATLGPHTAAALAALTRV
jgi:2-phospho-L-lactate guanylyltransferase